MAGTSVIRTSIIGQMPGGEIWSINPCFFLLDEPADISNTEVNTIATAIDSIAVGTNLQAFLSSDTKVTGCRVEARDRDGTLNELAEHVRTTPVGGTGTNPHPYQSSVVFSLKSVYPGAQGRGRLYWPATGAQLVSASLRLTSALQTAGLAAMKTYLAAIEAAVAVTAGPARLSVWSRTGSAFHGVTELRIGDVLDTQRRRRDSLVESYATVSYP